MTPEVHIDNKYIAFLLLEAMYRSGKIDRDTYTNILRQKEEYLKKQENNRKRN